MAGLRKAKKYDWKDSNLALFGSDTEKQVKKESAESEPAWEGAGQEVSLRIWRIEKFQVTDVAQEDHGKFFDGDSYIVLNTYQNEGEDELLYDVHFWIGKYSTQDEYGTAAYKTVELDTFLDDKAVQHREVDGHESDLFKGYFPAIVRMKGGAESGFRHVEPTEYKPRLLRFSGTGRTIEMSEEKSLSKDALKTGDVYIVDNGLSLYQWNGAESSGQERFKAAAYLQELEGERGSARSEVVDEGDVSGEHPMFEVLTEDNDEEGEDPAVDDSVRILKKISNEGGSVNLHDVKEGDLSMEDLVSDDVFLVDAGTQVFVWVGNGADAAERKNGLPYAQVYLQEKDCPFVPISVVSENRPSAAFISVFE